MGPRLLVCCCSSGPCHFWFGGSSLWPSCSGLPCCRPALLSRPCCQPFGSLSAATAWSPCFSSWLVVNYPPFSLFHARTGGFSHLSPLFQRAYYPHHGLCLSCLWFFNSLFGVAGPWAPSSFPPLPSFALLADGSWSILPVAETLGPFIQELNSLISVLHCDNHRLSLAAVRRIYWLSASPSLVCSAGVPCPRFFRIWS